MLGFCDSQRDLEVVQKILSQVRNMLFGCFALTVNQRPLVSTCLIVNLVYVSMCSCMGIISMRCPTQDSQSSLFTNEIVLNVSTVSCLMNIVLLLQTCQAYASDGGRVIVVMTQREKIGMETLFRRIIPPHKRCGCNFVFRQVIFESGGAYMKRQLVLLLCMHGLGSMMSDA